MNTKQLSDDRRSFLKKTAGLGALTALGGLLPDSAAAALRDKEPVYPEKGHVFLCPPYLQNPRPTAMTLRWINNWPSYGWVEFGETPSLGHKAQSVTDGLVDAYNRVNKVTLHALKPGTTYYYRVVSKAISSFKPYHLEYGKTIATEVKSFVTPARHPDRFTMLIMNDIHDRPHSIPLLMGLNKQEPFDMVFFNGDMFNYQTDEQQIIDHMLAPCIESFAGERPFMYVRGNHETRGKYRRELPQYFTNPEERHYFSYAAGPVHFIVLDTGEDKEDDHPVYAGLVDFDGYREEQARWLEQEMQTAAYKKAAFRVVLMHIPAFYSGDWHGTMHCRKLFAPLFDRYKVDLCIHGHTHRYGVHPPVAGKHDYPIIIGGGPKEGDRTIIRLQADKKQLRINMLDDSGKEVGKYVL